MELRLCRRPRLGPLGAKTPNHPAWPRSWTALPAQAHHGLAASAACQPPPAGLASFLGPDPAQVTAAAGAAQVGARSLLLLATNGQQS